VTFKDVSFGLDTGFIRYLPLTTLLITISQWHSHQFTQLQSTERYRCYIVTQSTVHYNTHGVLLFCCPSSPWVPAFHGGRTEHPDP
jgi:hypothetical protein